MEIKFYYSLGFTGADYYLIINNKRYDLYVDSELKAIEKAKNALESMKINFNGEIKFEWDGSL